MSEQDYDQLFEHEYDGIKEYDNPLPGWWVNLFWISVLFCFPYLLYFHGNEGRGVEDQYQAEVAAFAQQLLETYGELEPDPPTISRFMDDPVAMAGMASVFRSKCAQCHKTDGSGQVGPNLTDRHWINVAEITDIYKVLTEGVILKGMPAWTDQLTDTQRVLMSSYVAGMSRNPVAGGKASQGQKIGPWPVAAPEDAGGDGTP